MHVARSVPRRAPLALTSGSEKTSTSPTEGRRPRGALSTNLNVDPLLVSLKVIVRGAWATAGAAARPSAARLAARTTARCGKVRPSCVAVSPILVERAWRVGILCRAVARLRAGAAAVALTLSQRRELRPRPRVGDLLAREPRAARGDDPPLDVVQRVHAVGVGVDEDRHARLGGRARVDVVEVAAVGRGVDLDH